MFMVSEYSDIKYIVNLEEYSISDLINLFVLIKKRIY